MGWKVMIESTLIAACLLSSPLCPDDAVGLLYEGLLIGLDY